jgi:hypothetical protein
MHRDTKYLDEYIYLLIGTTQDKKNNIENYKLEYTFDEIIKNVFEPSWTFFFVPSLNSLFSIETKIYFLALEKNYRKLTVFVLQ